MSWQTTRLVEFQHCDPAGIVFYPRYFEMINSVIEEYFRTHIGYSFKPMHFTDRRGVPTAKITVEFHAPSFLEDLLTFTLTAVRIGKSSVNFQITSACEGAARLTADTTLVQVDMASGKSTPWPDAVRDRMKNT